MNFGSLSFLEKERLKRTVIIVVIILFLIMCIIGFFIGRSLLEKSYDTKKETIAYLNENYGDNRVSNGQGVFNKDDIPEIQYTSAEILDMNTEERYNVDLNQVSKRRVWDLLGEVISLDGCTYEFGSSSTSYIYKIYGTNLGDILVQCGTITGEVQSIYKDGLFSENDKDLLSRISSFFYISSSDDGEVAYLNKSYNGGE